VRQGRQRHDRPAAITHDVYDVSGAGDTVAAVLALALAAKVDIWQACLLANMAGGIVVGKMARRPRLARRFSA